MPDSRELHSRSTTTDPWVGIGSLAIFSGIVWLAIVLCLDPAGSYPRLPEGPGLTVDEIFNVEQGVYLVEQARALGWLNLVPGTSQEAYNPRNGYNPDHPPLGRWWLGLHHHLAWWLFPPHDPDGPIVTACARTGSATAFVLTLFLIGYVSTRWSGATTGLFTSISLALMPRVYGHAHLASLETITNLTTTASVLAVAALWNGQKPPTWRAAGLAGLVLGLALLTKIQAILIPIPVIFWTIWRWRTQGILPLVVWGGTAVIVFFGSWPYLWLDPAGHLFEYLGRTTDRATIYVWYLGERFADKNVPWHYPWMMFLVTVPLSLLGLGLLGVVARWIPNSPRPGETPDENARTRNDDVPEVAISGFLSRSRDAQFGSNGSGACCDGLLLGSLLFPMIVFSLPGIAVYDGERLFLSSFPLWAIFVGRGAFLLSRLIHDWTRSRRAPLAMVCILLLLVGRHQFSMSPCQLCYYNGLASMFPPSEISQRPLFEVDYWGVSVTRSLLERMVAAIPEGATVAIAPTLHQFQADDYRRQSPVLRRHGVRMIEASYEEKLPDFICVFLREADLPETGRRPDIGSLAAPAPNALIESTIREGRLLAYVVKTQ